jgi:hypothetical protein
VGYFDGEHYVTGSQLAHEGAGTRAGVRQREREPIKRPHIKQQAKLLVPASGPRDGDYPTSRFDVGSKADRRDLTRAAEFVASMDGDQAEKYREWLAAEMGELEKNVGPADDGRQEHAERMSLTLDLADDVEQQAAEGAEAQLEFYAWAMEQFGGREEFFKWADEQDDPKAAMAKLAEEYLVGQEEGEDAAREDGEHDGKPSDADIAFSAWVTETIGEHGIAQLSRLGDAD